MKWGRGYDEEHPVYLYRQYLPEPDGGGFTAGKGRRSI